MASAVALSFTGVDVATLPDGVTELSDPQEQAMVTNTRKKDTKANNTFLLEFMLSSLSMMMGDFYDCTLSGKICSSASCFHPSAS
jgi:hypothetical protein